MATLKPLKTSHPELWKQIDQPWANEHGIDINKLTAGSSVRLRWYCELKHHWETIVRHRALSKSNCPYCGNKKVWSGFNDFATTHPQFLKEIDYELTPNLPTEVIAGSDKLLSFKCGKGTHSYYLSPKRKTQGVGCGVCHGIQIVKGINDAGSLIPELATQYDPTHHLNQDKTIHEIAPTSPHKRGWRCELNHSWIDAPVNRVIRGKETGQYRLVNGCPYCGNRKLLAGFNDIATVSPKLAREFHLTHPLNKGLTPDQVIAGGRQIYGWKCERCEHEWEASINRRYNLHQDCGNCTESHSSKVEDDLREKLRPLLQEVNTLRPRVKLPTTDGKAKTWRPDITAATSTGQKVIIEYDGAYWHKGREDKDIQKSEAFLTAGYKVVRVRETNFAAGTETLLEYEHPSFHQISYTYSRDEKDLEVLAQEITAWLERQSGENKIQPANLE